jgi:hypothetical protein
MISRGARRCSAFALAVAFAVAMAGCEKPQVAGRYRDASQTDLVYEFRPDGTWTAVWEKKVPMGLFAQGSARRLQGTYELRGRQLRLTCLSVDERDPVSVDFAPVRVFDGEGEVLFRGYDHGFVVEEGKLVPSEPDHPFGGGELVPVE